MNRNGMGPVRGETKKLLAEEVFAHIASQIIDGTLAPGQRIRDVQVAEGLHVSRTPVREALQRLERLGLVTMYPSRYTEVTTVTPQIVEQTLEFAGYQAGLVARMAVPKLDDAERAHLADLVGQLSASHRSSDISRTRWAVFSYLADRCGNVQQRRLIQDAGIALFRNLREWIVPEEDVERMQRIYADFGVAVRAADGDSAERLAREMHYVRVDAAQPRTQRSSLA